MIYGNCSTVESVFFVCGLFSYHKEPWFVFYLLVSRGSPHTIQQVSLHSVKVGSGVLQVHGKLLALVLFTRLWIQTGMWAMCSISSEHQAYYIVTWWLKARTVEPEKPFIARQQAINKFLRQQTCKNRGTPRSRIFYVVCAILCVILAKVWSELSWVSWSWESAVSSELSITSWQEHKHRSREMSSLSSLYLATNK